jgi:hypothetical protein
MHQNLGAAYGPLPIRLALPLLLVGAVVAVVVVYDMYRTYWVSTGSGGDG